MPTGRQVEVEARFNPRPNTGSTPVEDAKFQRPPAGHE